MYSLHIISIKVVIGKNECIMYKFSIHTFMTFESIFLINAKFPNATSSVPEGKLMGVELIGVYKSGSINWG